ncbi:uncharacterized protein BX663DRAFT_497524 [Cokeromyces recurvatus]|uniref:uncharacterized protein n=1 Tax=Cokeromyces recurvatus TaxID=90255 RepID=UPI0022212ADA|nr:uncharacterized protein BX663DRAFT_497524 [Cokeromyces recurvatus]KAI7906765.1 hypothetical protein BX663DRAFT_497524 [Cokeromyces recurvatus]
MYNMGILLLIKNIYLEMTTTFIYFECVYTCLNMYAVKYHYKCYLTIQFVEAILSSFIHLLIAF